MNLEKRIEKLEYQLSATGNGKVHTVLVARDENKEQALEKFKSKNDVGSDDEFQYFVFIDPSNELRDHSSAIEV